MLPLTCRIYSEVEIRHVRQKVPLPLPDHWRHEDGRSSHGPPLNLEPECRGLDT